MNEILETTDGLTHKECACCGCEGNLAPSGDSGFVCENCGAKIN